MGIYQSQSFLMDIYQSQPVVMLIFSSHSSFLLLVNIMLAQTGNELAIECSNHVMVMSWCHRHQVKQFYTIYHTYSRITRVCSTKFSSMSRGVGLYASNSCLTLAKHDRPDGHAVKMRMPRSFHKDKGKNKYIVQLINFYLIFFCFNLNGDSHSTSKSKKNIQLFAEMHGNRATPSYLLASV